MKRKRGGLEIKRRKNGKTLELRWGRTERELIGKRWEVGYDGKFEMVILFVNYIILLVCTLLENDRPRV